jgi:hypothetical protein
MMNSIILFNLENPDKRLHSDVPLTAQEQQERRDILHRLARTTDPQELFDLFLFDLPKLEGGLSVVLGA